MIGILGEKLSTDSCGRQARRLPWLLLSKSDKEPYDISRIGRRYCSGIS